MEIKKDDVVSHPFGRSGARIHLNRTLIDDDETLFSFLSFFYDDQRQRINRKSCAKLVNSDSGSNLSFR